VTEGDQKPEELLKRVPLFARLGRRGLRTLAGLCMPREYPSDTLLITEGDTGLGLFILTSGRVEVYKGEGEGRIQLAELERGAILGEMSLIDDQPRSASAVTLEPTNCLLITRGSFQTLVKKDPEIAWCVVPTLADRIRELQQRMMEDEAALASVGEGKPSPGEEQEKAEGRGAEAKESEEDLRRSTEDALLGLVRGQYALALAGFAGIRGLVRAFESFLRTLASETDIDDSERLGEVTRKLPRGLVSALDSGLREAEKAPEQLLEKYRCYRSEAEKS
jgi:CRP/FNR family cyclic AMP-dependent transcriptional regulator